MPNYAKTALKLAAQEHQDVDKAGFKAYFHVYNPYDDFSDEYYPTYPEAKSAYDQFVRECPGARLYVAVHHQDVLDDAYEDCIHSYDDVNSQLVYF